MTVFISSNETTTGLRGRHDSHSTLYRSHAPLNQIFSSPRSMNTSGRAGEDKHALRYGPRPVNMTRRRCKGCPTWTQTDQTSMRLIKTRTLKHRNKHEGMHSPITAIHAGVAPIARQCTADNGRSLTSTLSAITIPLISTRSQPSLGQLPWSSACCYSRAVLLLSPNHPPLVLLHYPLSYLVT